MIVAVFAVAYVAAAAALAFWIDQRAPRLAPTEFRWAVLHLVAAGAANQLLDGPLGGLVARSLPEGPVIATIAIVLPLVVYVCLAAIWVLRIAQRSLSGLLR